MATSAERCYANYQLLQWFQCQRKRIMLLLPYWLKICMQLATCLKCKTRSGLNLCAFIICCCLTEMFSGRPLSSTVKFPDISLTFHSTSPHVAVTHVMLTVQYRNEI